MDIIPPTPSASARFARFVVPATVMLSFVSFWRASAIVLSDLGSSAYYVGGLVEGKVGKTAPWFVLGIILFSYAVRAVYMESCSMFTRGGVYRVVREALGGTAAKFSVGALLFDYVLTGPISAVSAGLYLAGLLDHLTQQFLGGTHLPLPAPLIAAAFAVVVILYFWWTNTVGVPFSSLRALRVMQLTTVMVVLLIAWCLLTILIKGAQPVPLPLPGNITFSEDALGWLKGTPLPGVAVVAIGIGLGHALLAMSGEESLAQVYREIEAPKRKNLVRTGLIVFGYSLVFTAMVSFFAVMLIPDAQRQGVQDDLIGGLAAVLVGPAWLTLAFQGFVVAVGVLILSAAVNTSLIGANGVLNRVAEDGTLPDWVRKPHRQYGTTYRLIAAVSVLQLATVVLSRGDVTLLGEAYAFGVAWSFAMKALAVTVLRYTRPDAERWRVPLNLRVGGHEVPLGLLTVTVALFALAAVNLFTKEAATVGGVGFTLVLFVLFTWSERRYANRREGSAGVDRIPDRFQLECRRDLSPAHLGVKPGAVLVAIRGDEELPHLKRVLAEHDPGTGDVVAVTVSQTTTGGLADDEAAKRVVDAFETAVFSCAVAVAEDAGKPVVLLGLPTDGHHAALLEAALDLKASCLVLGPGRVRLARAEADAIRAAWTGITGRKGDLAVEIDELDGGAYRLKLDGDR